MHAALYIGILYTFQMPLEKTNFKQEIATLILKQVFGKNKMYFIQKINHFL